MISADERTASAIASLGGETCRSTREPLLGLELAADVASEFEPVLRLSRISSTPAKILFGLIMPDPVLRPRSCGSAWEGFGSGAAAAAAGSTAAAAGPVVGEA